MRDQVDETGINHKQDTITHQNNSSVERGRDEDEEHDKVMEMWI